MSPAEIGDRYSEGIGRHRKILPTRWIVWGRSLLALAVVGMLLVLGIANIALRAQAHQVEDGVLWADRAEGVTVAEVADRSPAARAGIQRGDILLAVNGTPVDRRADVVEYQHRGVAGTTLHYTLIRLGTRQALDVELAPAPRGSSMYFVLAAVHIATLVVTGILWTMIDLSPQSGMRPYFRDIRAVHFGGKRITVLGRSRKGKWKRVKTR